MGSHAKLSWEAHGKPVGSSHGIPMGTEKKNKYCTSPIFSQKWHYKDRIDVFPLTRHSAFTLSPLSRKPASKSEIRPRGCGVVWCGVVWCGVVWCGVVLYLAFLKGIVVTL